MGGSALRAMAFAKPLIVLGELGFAELLTPETAAVFLWQGFYGLGNGDTRAEGLAALIRPLLNDTRRRSELGGFSRRWVESRFSLAEAGRKQLDLYEQWLGSRSSRSVSVREAVHTASQLISYKLQQRLRRLRGYRSSEDFNAISEIAKVVTKAGQE